MRWISRTAPPLSATLIKVLGRTLFIPAFFASFRRSMTPHSHKLAAATQTG